MSRDQFDRDGYVIKRDVFSAAEIEELRTRAYAAAARYGMDPAQPSTTEGFFLPADLSALPELSHLLTDERVVSLARELVGDTPIYFRDSAVVLGGKERGWHKDNRNADRFDPAREDWQGDYPLIRMGIYCEDHRRHSGGLSLRKGSHVYAPSLRTRRARLFWGAVAKVRQGKLITTLASGMIAQGKPVHLDTGTGDVAAWSLRTTHSAHTQRLRILRNLKLPPFIESRLPGFLFSPDERERVAIFITFAAPSAHTDRYLEWVKERDYFQDKTGEPVAPEFAAALARSRQVAYVDPWSDADSQQPAVAASGD